MGEKTNKVFPIDKRTIHVNKFVRKDSNALNNLRLERVDWESNDVFCEGGVSVCF